MSEFHSKTMRVERSVLVLRKSGEAAGSLSKDDDDGYENVI